MNKEIQNAKQLRADLMALEEVLLAIKDSRETSTAYTHLQEARMGCGNLIKTLEPESNPYPESHNPSSEKIEPVHIDQEITPMDIDPSTKEMSKTQLVKWLRFEIEARIQVTKGDAEDFVQMWPTIHSVFIVNSMINAKNWLGMELGRLRDLQPWKNNDTTPTA